MTTKEISPSRAKRRALLRVIQKAQHAAPGVVLFQHGMHAFQDGASGWHLLLAVAEVTTASAVFVSLLLAMRKVAGDIKAGRLAHVHTGIDWTDVFLGLMLYTEVAARYPEVHKIWSPSFLLGTVMIVLGFFGPQVVAFKSKLKSAVR